MSKTEQGGADELVAAELAEVAAPWNIVDLDGGHVRELSARQEDVEAALRSLSALLRFKANHAGEVAKAEDEMPELVNAYWIGWSHELVAAMPLLSAMTWQNFQSWAHGFDPSWIDRSWREPPKEFIHAVAWMWCNGRVEMAAITVIDWLDEIFGEQPDHPLLLKFFELAAVYAPQVGNFGGHLIEVMGAVGRERSVPYLDRIAGSSGLSANLRRAVEEECASIRRRSM
ncbi:hypothetical protein ABZ801_00730 [Actinomadura sp. NPDC047616]|uniref:hypothetical protein n=1 Tax=Actinomadura sp. NPDC047616 TaxID=3155914 RepID=UPI0033D14D5F